MGKSYVAGTLESSDCLITLSPADKLKIEIDTVVHEAFYDHIKTLIEKTLAEESLENVRLRCQDQGALDYTIKARLKTAILKYKESEDG